MSENRGTHHCTNIAMGELEQLHAVLHAIEDMDLDIHWNNLEAFINCNDLFWWGCSDCEQLSFQNIPDLKQAFEDAGSIWGSELWVCRKRAMRPQGAFYHHIPTELHDLFSACGIPRAADFLNPQTQSGKWYSDGK